MTDVAWEIPDPATLLAGKVAIITGDARRRRRQQQRAAPGARAFARLP